MITKTYRTVSLEQQKTMSGLELVKGLADGCCRSTPSHRPYATF